MRRRSHLSKQMNGVKSTPFVSSRCTIYILEAPPPTPLFFFFQYFMVTTVFKLKTVFTDCRPVCSKGCLLMSEPMRRGASGEGDEVRAASHAQGGLGWGGWWGAPRDVRGLGSPVSLTPWMGRRCGGWVRAVQKWG